MPSNAASWSIPAWSRFQENPSSVMVTRKCLAISMGIERFPDPLLNPFLAFEAMFLPLRCGHNILQPAFRGLQQGFALAGPLRARPRATLEKFATIQMVDIHLPTTDGRQWVLPRHTRPNQDHKLLLHQLNLELPKQPPPRIPA